MRTDISLSQEASSEYRLMTNAARMVTRYDQGSTDTWDGRNAVISERRLPDR
jgi:hypothetical protein